MGDHPTDSSAQEEGTNREDILGKRVLDDDLTKKNSVTFSSTQWSKQPSMIGHQGNIQWVGHGWSHHAWSE